MGLGENDQSRPAGKWYPHPGAAAGDGAAIQLEATLDYMTSMIHAHPTLAEVMLEAYEIAAHGKSIHTL